MPLGIQRCVIKIDPMPETGIWLLGTGEFADAFVLETFGEILSLDALLDANV